MYILIVLLDQPTQLNRQEVMHKYLWFLSIVCSTSVINARKFEILYEWSWIDYLWESEEHREAAILSGNYNYTKPVVIDVDVWKGRKKKDRNS